MAEKRFAYAVAVTVYDADDPSNKQLRRTAQILGEVDAEVEVDLTERGNEALRAAVKQASERGHAGRLMGRAFDDGC
jgi:hypothetical protein